MRARSVPTSLSNMCFFGALHHHMAMTRQLWTLNGLATELGKDRRTVGRALRNVAPDGTTGDGYRGWFMETALRAFGAVNSTNDLAPTPRGFEVIDRVENPVDKAQLLLFVYLIYRIGPLAAATAVMAGAPMKVVYAIRNLLTSALAMEAEDVCAALGIGRFAFAEEPGILKLELLQEPDWERLAKLAGEPVDMQAWQFWAHERGFIGGCDLVP